MDGLEMNTSSGLRAVSGMKAQKKSAFVKLQMMNLTA